MLSMIVFCISTILAFASVLFINYFLSFPFIFSTYLAFTYEVCFVIIILCIRFQFLQNLILTTQYLPFLYYLSLHWEMKIFLYSESTFILIQPNFYPFNVNRFCSVEKLFYFIILY